MLADIVNRLKSEYDISVVTFDPVDAQPLYPLSEGITVDNLAIGQSHNKATIGETLKRIKSLRHYMKSQKPDLVIGFMHSMFVPASFALIGTGVPIIASEHIVPQHYYSRRLEFFLFILSAFFVKRITVLSETIKRLYPLILQRKMVAITNPVVWPKETTVSEKRKKIILNIGRLSPQKNQKLLIEAFYHLSQKCKDWRLRIVGDGSLKNMLEELVSKYGLEKNVEFVGEVSDVSKEYREASIFVMSSDYESFGLVAAEAMSYGIPVVGRETCLGVNELIVHKENGVLVQSDKDNAEGLAEAIYKLIVSKEERHNIGTRGQLTAEKHRIDSVVALWKGLIEDTIFSNK